MDDPAATLPPTRAMRATSLAALALAILIGAFLGTANWASHMPDSDLFPYVHDVGQLVHHGTLPVLGNVQSFGGFNPPGDTYLFLPGALLFRDVRLWEMPAAVAFYVALVIGVRLLLGRFLASTTATWCAAAFALSAGAIETAGTLWTRMQSPAFLAWTLLFLVLWGERRQAWWLAAALATWAASLYVFPETLLAGVMFPAVWLLRRPPIRVAPIFAVIVASIAVAWPYLRYESAHGFSDVIRIFTQQKLPIVDLRGRWCDPTRSLFELGDDGVVRPVVDEPPPTLSLAGRLVAKAAAIVSLCVSNATRNGPFAIAMLGAIAIVAVGIARGAIGERVAQVSARWGATAARVAGVACLIVAAVVSLTLVRRLVGDHMPMTANAIVNLQAGRALLALLGIALVAGPVRTWASRRVVPALRDGGLALAAWPTLATLAASLAVATPGRQDRGWQLWPLVFVVTLVGVDRWMSVVWTRAAGRTRGAIVACCAGLLIFNGSLVGRARLVSRSGWSGPTPPIVTLLDAVAARSSGLTSVRLGMHAAVIRFEFAAPTRDIRARVGSGGDAYLLNRYGIANDTHCAEGLSDADDWRIVSPPAAGMQLLSTRPGEYDGWQTIAEAGSLTLLRRP